MKTGADFSQAIAAYKNTANAQVKKTTEQTLSQSPRLPGEEPTQFKPSFDELVAKGLDNARDAGYKSEGVSAESIANKAEFHELVAAVNNAELTLRTVVAVRDRMVNAYQDILKMPI